MVSDWPRRRRSRAPRAARSASLSTGSGGGGADGGGGAGGGADPKIPPMGQLLPGIRRRRTPIGPAPWLSSVLVEENLEHKAYIVKAYFLQMQKKFPRRSDCPRMQPDQPLGGLDAGGWQRRCQAPRRFEHRNRQRALSEPAQMRGQVGIPLPIWKMADFPSVRQRIYAHPAPFQAQINVTMAESRLQPAQFGQPGFLDEDDHCPIGNPGGNPGCRRAGGKCNTAAWLQESRSQPRFGGYCCHCLLLR